MATVVATSTVPVRMIHVENSKKRIEFYTWRSKMQKNLAAVAMAASIVLSHPFSSGAATESTPFLKGQEPMEVGLLDGKIRPCPLDINPNCVSTSTKYGVASALPWVIPNKDVKPIERIEKAIKSTEKNPTVLEKKHLDNGGDYLLAEVDGFLGRDLVEFLVKGDTVTYRSMAKNVKYIYPLTTPLTDFGRQQKRISSLESELGWTPPGFQGFPTDGDYIED